LSIERALQKAKEMMLQREAVERAASGRKLSSHRQERSEPSPHAPRASALPAQPMRPLKTVSVDATACEENRILLETEANGPLARAEPAYRVLRSRIQQRLGAENHACVGVTSPGPSEGKTLTTLNMAITIVREKQRPVYLLDLDMRNPSVLRYLGVRLPVQISEYLSGTMEPDEALFATSIDMLMIAGNWEPVSGGSELLANNRLDDLIAHVRRRSPDAIILIDLPPVTNTDEALKVAPRVDVMFLVVAEGKTRRDQLTRTLNLLSDTNIGGIILNRSAETVGSYYYGH
jgi:Mrp family chromosome partitioning ATPase